MKANRWCFTRRSVLAGGAGLIASARLVDAMAQASIARIGWLGFNAPARGNPFLDAFLAGLSDLGYAPGRNLNVVEKYANDRPENVVPLAQELVRQDVRLILTTGATSRYAVEAIKTVPIVYAFSGDPIMAGFAESLARPKGNATGMTFMSVELNGKRIELFRETIPGMKRLAVLANPLHAGEGLEYDECHRAAKQLGLDLFYQHTRDLAELDAALDRVREARVDGLIALPDQLLIISRKRVIDFCNAHRIPSASGWAVWAESGGVVTYGPKLRDCYRRLATYVDRILKGTPPGDLPIEQPTTFELVINLKTAAALGLTVPSHILARADEVIE